MNDNVINFNEYRKKLNKDKHFNVLFICKNSKHAFAYNYLLGTKINHEADELVISFVSGEILIKGKRLKNLYNNLQRYETTEISIEDKNIDDIQITLHRDSPSGLHHE